MSVKRLEFMAIPPEVREAFNPFPAGPPPPLPEGPFRMGELSRISGVAVGTIKYYLREGLLPPGEATAKTQAHYGAEHLRRLRLIGVMADVGGLSIAQLRRIAGIFDEGGEEHAPDPIAVTREVSYGVATAGRSSGRRAPGAGEPGASEAVAAAEARAASDAFVDALGFEVDPASPARADLAEALLALRTLGIAADPLVFYDHARLAYELAEIESASAGPVTDPARKAEAITIGSVVFGAAFMALRLMAHEHEMRRQEDRPVATDSACAPAAQAELDSGPRPG